MKIIAIIKCNNCHTLKEEELKIGENFVRGCICGYFGEEDKKVTINIENMDR
jgi:hypothetical protein